MANWMLSPSQVRVLVEEYLLPPGFRCRTTYDAMMDGVMGVIDMGYPLGPSANFRLDGLQLSLSQDCIVQRLRDQIQPQLNAFLPASQPTDESFDLDATG